MGSYLLRTCLHKIHRLLINCLLVETASIVHGNDLLLTYALKIIPYKTYTLSCVFQSVFFYHRRKRMALT